MRSWPSCRLDFETRLGNGQPFPSCFKMETGATDQAPLRLTPPRGSCEEANPERQPKRRQRMLMHSFPDRFGQRIADIPDRLAAAVAESAKHIA